ncbi:unnamed protein product, partial [Tilletia controversa]
SSSLGGPLLKLRSTSPPSVNSPRQVSVDLSSRFGQPLLLRSTLLVKLRWTSRPQIAVQLLLFKSRLGPNDIHQKADNYVGINFDDVPALEQYLRYSFPHRRSSGWYAGRFQGHQPGLSSSSLGIRFNLSSSSLGRLLLFKSRFDLSSSSFGRPSFLKSRSTSVSSNYGRFQQDTSPRSPRSPFLQPRPKHDPSTGRRFSITPNLMDRG